jgi:hypothetical protein
MLQKPPNINNKTLRVVIDVFILYLCYYASFIFPITININMAEDKIFVVGKILAKL